MQQYRSSYKKIVLRMFVARAGFATSLKPFSGSKILYGLLKNGGFLPEWNDCIVGIGSG
jgi:hypothetical protein